MTNTRFYSILILFLFSCSIYGQKFGKLDGTEVQQKVHPKDSSAVATILLSKCTIEYELNSDRSVMNIDYWFRIKVYKEAGEKYASFTVKLYNQGSSKERLNNIKGYTFNEINGDVERLKLDKHDIYREKTSENTTTIKFAMPNVKSGSVIDVRYRKITPFLYTIPKWYFQNEIPTDYSKFKIKLPEFIGITPVSSGYVPVSRSIDTGYSNGAKTKIIEQEAQDVPALHDDDYVLNINDYRTGIKYELYEVSSPGSITKYFSKDWVTIGKNLYNNKYCGKQARRKLKKLNHIIEQASALNTDTEKIQFLYDYVRTNYTWNKKYGRSGEKKQKDFLVSKTGNVANINLLLVNLLSKVGLDAKPFIIKSRFNGILNTAFPSLSELNYTLAYVPINDDFILLDASSKYVPMGQLPIRAINLNGLLIEEKTSQIISITNNDLVKSQSSVEYNLDTELGSLVGKGKSKRSLYSGVKFRQNLDKEEDDDDTQDIDESKLDDNEEEEAVDDVKIDDEYKVISIENLEDINKPVIISFEETKYSCVKKIMHKILIDADLDFGIGSNPFIEDTRDFPVFYNYLVDIRRIATIPIPDGYKIESLPKSINMKTPNGMAKFMYEAKELYGKLVVSYILKINDDLFLPEEYEGLKKFYDLVIEKQDEKIILSQL